jgi:SAM-dependent methyltransferase
MGIQYTAGAALSSAFIPTVFRLNNLLTLQGYLKQYCSGGPLKVLDVGCGDGVHALYLSRAGVSGQYEGIDVTSRFSRTTWQSIASASKGLRADFRVIDATKLSRDSLGEFQAIICLTALEHIADYRRAIANMSQVLAAGGALFITVPSAYSWLFSFGKHADHYFNARDIEAAAVGCGLTLKKSYRLGGALGFLFDLLYSWIMAVVSQFTDSGAFVAGVPQFLKKIHYGMIRCIHCIDAFLPCLESGYAYVFTKANIPL